MSVQICVIGARRSWLTGICGAAMSHASAIVRALADGLISIFAGGL